MVEREFGGCSVFTGGDCEGRNLYPERLGECYLHHIGRKYWQRLDELGFSEAALVKGAICPFANGSGASLIVSSYTTRSAT